MYQCPVCEKALAEESSFCPNCGQSLQLPDSAPTILPEEERSEGRVERSASLSAMLSSRASGPEGRFIPGTVFDGRYRLVALLGKGGMGEVYRAQDLKLGQTVALKFLPEELEKDESRLMRFLEEVRLSRQISHPNVCRVHDVREADGHHFLSMEFVDGEDLASLLRRIGRLPNDKAMQIARQLCAGLAAAHREGILHRDLKPANVMIDGRGHVRITDFGLAGLAEEIDGAEIRVGTPAYMAPEQVAGKEVTVKSDLYSLGLVLYELFTGKPAFRAGNVSELMKAHETPPASPGSVLEGIDPVVERLILRCLEANPNRRPASALAILAGLPGGDPLGEVLSAGDTPSPEMVAASGKAGRLSVGFALACLVFFLLGCIASNLLLNQFSLLEYVPLANRPEVLEAEAREILRESGHELSRHRLYRFDVDQDLLEYIEENENNGDRWDRLYTILPSPVSFWYRQSPRPLVPENQVGPVGLNDPPARVSGMATVRLGHDGRLLELLVVPPEFDESNEVQPFHWGSLFQKAGLAFDDFEKAEPSWNPLLDCDQRAAWRGFYRGQEHLEIRVETGSYRGKPVYFRVVTPWTKPSRVGDLGEGVTERIASWLRIGMALIILGGAAALARRNSLRGRGDRRGALRLGGYAFVLCVLASVLRIDHVAASAELVLLFWSVSASLFLAAFIWVSYIALEPYVRRIWPESLVSWTRLMAGSFEDPLVGRDILYGGVAGVLVALLIGLAFVVPVWLGLPSAIPRGPDMDALSGTRQAVSLLLNLQFGSVSSPMVVLIAILIFRMLVRRHWLAVGLAFLVFVILQLLQTAAPPSVFSWLLLILLWMFVVLVITRFGLLTSILMFYFAEILLNFPIPSDFSPWYFSRFMLFQLLLVGVVIYGFCVSVKGQRLVGDDLI